MNLLITGSSGFVGSTILDDLRANTAFNLIAPIRGGAKSGSTEKRITHPRIGTLLDISSEMVESVDVVIHIAGAAHDVSGAKMSADYYTEVNIEATRHLLELAIGRGCRQFIFVSSVGVHGISSENSPLTETSPIRPYNHYSRSKAEAEKLVVEKLRDTKCAYTIFRPPLIIGENAPGNLQRLCALIKRRAPLPFAGVTNRRSFMALQNFSSVILHALDNPDFFNRTFLVADRNPLSTQQMVWHLARGMGIQPLFFPVPDFLIKSALEALGKDNLYQQLFCSLEIDASALYTVFDTDRWQPVEKVLEDVGHDYSYKRVK